MLQDPTPPEILDYDLDDDLLAEATMAGEARLRIYRPTAVSIVLGRGSRVDKELNLDAIMDDGVPLYRRRGGGCSVVLDPGNLIIGLALPLPGFGHNRRYWQLLSQWMIAGLASLGVEGVTQQGISDLVWQGRKISGACLYRPRNLVYYSATLLVDADLALMERYLKHPPREPEYRQGRRHGAFVGCVASERLNGAEEWVDALGQHLEHPLLLAARF